MSECKPRERKPINRKTLSRIYSSGHLFKNITDGMFYFILYWVMPLCNIIVGHKAINAIDQHSSFLNWDIMLLLIALNALYDCYGRFSEEACASNLNVLLMGFPNLILLVFSILLLFSIFSRTSIASIIFAYAYLPVTLVMIIVEISNTVSFREAVKQAGL